MAPMNIHDRLSMDDGSEISKNENFIEMLT